MIPGRTSSEQRLVRVSTFFLDLFLRGQLRPVERTDAPSDLRIVGGRFADDETIELVVESAAFPPLGKGEDPHILPTYTVGNVPKWGPLRWWRRFRAAWRVA